MTDNEGKDFDWADTDGDIVIEPVQALAVYLNPQGQVVIRQQGDSGHPQDDSVIVLPLDHAKRLATRLAAFVKRVRSEEKATT